MERGSTARDTTLVRVALVAIRATTTVPPPWRWHRRRTPILAAILERYARAAHKHKKRPTTPGAAGRISRYVRNVPIPHRGGHLYLDARVLTDKHYFVIAWSLVRRSAI